MKKLIFLLLTIILQSFQINAQPCNLQTGPIEAFNRTYGSPDTEVSQMVHQLPDGGFIIGGWVPTNGGDIHLIRTEPNGDVMWETSFGGPQNERIQWAMNNGLQVCSDGGFIIGGTTESYGAGGLDYYVIKINSTGDLQWYKTFGGTSDDYGRTIRETSDGGYIIVGLTFSFGVLGNDVYIVKMDENGNVGPTYPNTWQGTYNLNYWDNGQDIIETPDGYLITGVSYGVNGGGYLFKIDKDGNPENSYGTHDFQPGPAPPPIHDRGLGKFNILYPSGYGYNIENTIDGGYIIAGTIGAGADDGFLAKLDDQCNVEWQHIYPGPGANFAYAVQQLDSGEFVVAGETNGMGNGGWDFWLFGTDDQGCQLWQQTYGGPGAEWATALQKTQGGGFVVTGLNNSFGAGAQDFWLLKFLFIEEPANINGNLFVDNNGNCNFSGNETPLANQMIQAQADQNTFTTFTNFDGNYEFLVETETGNLPYTVSLVPNPTLNIHPNCSQNQVHTTPAPLISGDTYGPFDFPIEQFTDPCLSDIRVIPAPFEPANCPGLTTLTSPCQGFRHAYEIVFCNDLGQNDINLSAMPSEISITLPEGMSYVENSINSDCQDPNSSVHEFDEPDSNPAVVTPGVQQTLTWDNNSMGGLLPPSQCCLINFEVDVLNFAKEPFEITAEFNAWCVGNNPAPTTQDDLVEYGECSCDPNDKTALPRGCGLFGNIHKGQDISYVVRFENIGAGPAHDIEIRDVLDGNLDLSTFRLLRSSHSISNLQIESDNELVIRFNDIELPPAGKGEVLINIEPKANLPEGTIITNEAAIYFDSNPPVITNTTLNTFREVPSPTAAFTTTRECSLTLNTMDFTYTGGTEDGAAYSWDFGANASPSSSTEQDPSGIVFSNYGSQEVSLIVTRYGCTSTVTETVEVIDISCGNNGNKVLICHFTGENINNGQTICVSSNAVIAHLAHGDICGPCEANNLIHGGGSSAFNTTNLRQGVEIYPNPAADQLNINLHNYLEQEISISIYNHLGQQVWSLPKQKLANPIISIELDNFQLPEGIYLVSVNTAEGRQAKQFVIGK